MKRQSTKSMRLLPLCLVMSIGFFSIPSLLRGSSSEVNATVTNHAPPHYEYTINGREYKENGIIYDIPKEDDPSRDAEVVIFPNRAVIPSYVTVDGVQYTVRKIRSSAPQTLISDPRGWVTLPPTLKYCNLLKVKVPSGYGYGGSHGIVDFYGVANINVTNVDSFLNMDFFRQFVNLVYMSDFYPDPSWRLYLNGVELKDYDYVYPEGASMGTSLQNLVGVRSITIPASDTVRREPLNWWGVNGGNSQPEYPKWLHFKADKGYDLRYYNIIADSLDIPSGMTELNGYGYLGDSLDNYRREGRIRNFVRLPEGLKVINEMTGYPTMDSKDLPVSVTQINHSHWETDQTTLTIPSRWEKLNHVTFIGPFERINIEDSDEPLSVCELRVSSASEIYLGRNMVFDDSDPYIHLYMDCKTVILGPNVTNLPKHIFLVKKVMTSQDIEFEPCVPKYLICKGLTPPSFPMGRPEILKKWRKKVTLIVPEEAAEAYRNHPVWKEFITILTDGVSEVPVDKEIVKEEWYTLDGRILAEPERGKINIRVTRFSDNTTVRSKIAVPE